MDSQYNAVMFMVGLLMMMIIIWSERNENFNKNYDKLLKFVETGIEIKDTREGASWSVQS